MNECALNSHGCEQSCINTQGTYRCECRGGYRLSQDGKSCRGNVTIITVDEVHVRNEGLFGPS